MISELEFNAELHSLIARNLAGFEVIRQRRDGLIRAAIAFTLVECSTPADIANIPFRKGDSRQAGFILTTRTSKLSSHAGQRAYPGGRIDAGETPEQAALRELEEEVGLALGADRVLGRLDDYATRSGYLISPIVVWGGRDAELSANPAEVERIHRVPLRELLRDDAPILEPIAESRHPALKMPLGEEWFAAPSAAIAYQFREVALFGRATRVAHFEQPRFAWQ
jgi:8-oxo-dGTP pyrophosphatase MutT (NUDIX family)